jgi:hypothetical protein
MLWKYFHYLPIGELPLPLLSPLSSHYDGKGVTDIGMWVHFAPRVEIRINLVSINTASAIPNAELRELPPVYLLVKIPVRQFSPFDHW